MCKTRQSSRRFTRPENCGYAKTYRTSPRRRSAHPVPLLRARVDAVPLWTDVHPYRPHGNFRPDLLRSTYVKSSSEYSELSSHYCAYLVHPRTVRLRHTRSSYSHMSSHLTQRFGGDAKSFTLDHFHKQLVSLLPLPINNFSLEGPDQSQPNGGSAMKSIARQSSP